MFGPEQDRFLIRSFHFDAVRFDARVIFERIVNDPFSLRQFSVAEYDKMVETGILTTSDHVELLEGWIVNKMPQNPPHRTQCAVPGESHASDD